MATGKGQRQYLSLAAILRKRDGIKAMLNRENDEKNEEVTRINQRKLIFSFILASHAII